MSRDQINEIKKDKVALDAYQQAVRRIGRRDYSSYEMRDYLIKRDKYDMNQIELVISHLENRRFIDDERYLEERIDYFRSINRGNYRIIEDLKKRGFSEDVIETELLNEDNEDYIKRGIIRAEKFLKKQKKGSIKQRLDRLKRHLVRQGYDFSDANQIAELTKDHYTKEDELKSLKQLLIKSKPRYERRHDTSEAKERTIRHALSKGYNYDMIRTVIKELENEN